MTFRVERALLRPLLPLRKARMTTGKVPCYPGRARGSLRAVREVPAAPGWGGSPPVPSWSVPGGFGAKLPSPAQTRRGKLRISLWAPKSLPAKAEAQVPGGVHGGTGRVPLVHSSPLPRARRARHPLCPPCTALRAPFPPRSTGPGAHPEARSCVVTRLCACLGLRAAAQAATLPGPGPLACGPGSHRWASATAPGPGRPQRLRQPGPSQLVSPGSCIRRRRRPSPPQTTRGRQASGARPPGPRAAPVHAFLLLSPRRDGVLHTGSSRPPPCTRLPCRARSARSTRPALRWRRGGRGEGTAKAQVGVRLRTRRDGQRRSPFRRRVTVTQTRDRRRPLLANAQSLNFTTSGSPPVT